VTEGKANTGSEKVIRRVLVTRLSRKEDKAGETMSGPIEVDVRRSPFIASALFP